MLTAEFTWSPSQNNVLFDGSTSTADGSITDYTWDLGQGTIYSSGAAPTVLMGYDPGTYTVVLTITDDQGATASVSHDVTYPVVVNQRPMAYWGVNTTDLTATFQDGSADDGAVVGWLWDFGDGTTSIERNPVHTYAAADTYTVSLTVTDDVGQMSTPYTQSLQMPAGGGGGGGSGAGFDLTGTEGTFEVDFTSVASQAVTLTPDFDGYLVIQGDNGWQSHFEVVDSDGDPIQSSDGRLGLVWPAGQQATITITPATDPTPAQEPRAVTYTWSYAARASSAIVVGLAYDYVNETPCGLELTVSNGAANENVTFSVLGATEIPDFQTITLDEDGTLNPIITLPALVAGNYTLHAEGTQSGAVDNPFTVEVDALRYDDETRVVDTPPTVAPVNRWRLYDLRDKSVNWTFPHNPESWSNVFPPTDFTHGKTAAVDGQPLTWQAASRPWRMDFTGTVWDQAEYEQLVFWANLHRRFWLIDHRNRAWLITIEQLDAQAQVKPGYPWLHKYTVKTLVFMQGTTG